MRLELRNIGPLNRAAIDLDRFALLVGPNASGKTTLSTAAYAVLLSYAEAEWALQSYLRQRAYEIPPEQLSVIQEDLGPRFASLFRDALSEQLMRCYSPDLAKLPRRGRTGNGSAPRILVSDAPPGEEPWTIVFRLRKNGDFHLEPKHPDYSLPTFSRILDADDEARTIEPKELGRRFRRRLTAAPVYFPAARSGYVQMQSVLAALLLAALGRGYFQHVAVGKISGVAADFLQFLAGMHPSDASRLPSDTAQRLERELLHGHLRLTGTNDATKIIEFAPEGIDEYWPMDSAATSIAELAPLVLYLRHRARRRDLLLIDEPEAHLHPANQLVLADVLLELSSEIRGMVLGTHSEYFAIGISNSLLRRSAAGPENDIPVTVYSLVRAKATGGYSTEAIEVDPRTGFSVDQFTDVAEAAMDEAQNLFETTHHLGGGE